MKKIIEHLKENWIRHGFETLVVTVGILGAFTLNHWNEERKDRSMEKDFLRDNQNDRGLHAGGARHRAGRNRRLFAGRYRRLPCRHRPG